MIHNENDIELIKRVIQLYFDGTYQGEQSKLKIAFHPEAHITGYAENIYCDWTLSEFIHRVTAKPTAVMKDEKYDKEILHIDITNHAAMVKTKVVVGSLIFTDYISLIKLDNYWVIINKIFST